MSTAGIIAEYDPFHYGHLYQLQKAREMTGAEEVLVVLGSDFLQRGTPSMVDKRTRARMAVDAGADLVLSLPFIYSSNSAREYARGAVGILAGTGCVDFLSFGSETADPAVLKSVASLMNREQELSPLIRESLAKGLSHAESLTRAVETVGGKKAAELLRSPNDLLACEYIRFSEESGASFKIAPVKRTRSVRSAGQKPGSNGGEGDAGMPERTDEGPDAASCVSASQIRSLALNGGIAAAEPFVPASSFRILEDCFGGEHPRAVIDDMDRRMIQFLRYRILTSDRKDLSAILSAGEGIEKRLMEAAADQEISSVSQLADAVKTKRYTRSRVMRLLIHVLLGLRADDYNQLKGHYYARVLAFNEKGRKLLGRMRKTASIPVLSNLARLDRYDASTRRILELDLRAAGMYAMLRGDSDLTGGEVKYVPYMK